MKTRLTFVECLTCGAVYARTLADGTEYYHACPDLTDAEVIAALELPPDPATWTPEERFAFETEPRQRPNHRDENIAIDPARRDARRIKAIGLGEPKPRG